MLYPSQHARLFTQSVLKNVIGFNASAQSRTMLLSSFRRASSDPFDMVRGELEATIEQVRAEVVREHPSLAQAVDYYFTMKGKQVRPVLTLLMARALGNSNNSENTNSAERQRQIAPIVEMIHSATLLHEDVLDDHEAKKHRRRSNVITSNKFAVLAGDFLLTRASLLLSRVQSHAATEHISTAIAHVVEGNVLQTRATPAEAMSFDHYQMRTFLRTASLMANGCRSVAEIANASSDVKETAFAFGKEFGMTYQVIEEMLDYTAPSTPFGKPSLTYINRGIVTAPVLFALQKDKSIEALLQNGIKSQDDIDKILQAIKTTDALNDTMQLARKHRESALHHLEKLPSSDATEALKSLLEFIMTRKP
eukprot:TRINITY_DN9064_c0_g1_i1.p1 TRINITY_DN9064_c0_g1~~TRINITY_DN9064_c0_g1_i1.p1  ORF type:complete len:365 (-),score=98.42 TRINITY_DN9064_c0_g1_i1:257-1351(-)